MHTPSIDEFPRPRVDDFQSQKLMIPKPTVDDFLGRRERCCDAQHHSTMSLACRIPYASLCVSKSFTKPCDSTQSKSNTGHCKCDVSNPVGTKARGKRWNANACTRTEMDSKQSFLFGRSAESITYVANLAAKRPKSHRYELSVVLVDFVAGWLFPCFIRRRADRLSEGYQERMPLRRPERPTPATCLKVLGSRVPDLRFQT